MNTSVPLLIAEFQGFLETIELETIELETIDTQPVATECQNKQTEKNETDLYSLFLELATLKSEVKTESRQFKTALDDFKEVFACLRESHTENQHQNQDSLQRSRLELQNQRQTLLKPLLLEMLDMRDRLVASLHSIQQAPARGRFLARFYRREKQLLEGIKEGQQISLRRLDDRLTHYKVLPIQALKQPLNAEQMRVVALDQQPDIAPGIVTQELRKGFIWDGRILRCAEVKVNQLETNTP